MESNSKMRKGFMKGKLVMAFYKASKPSTTTTTTGKAVKTSVGTVGEKTSLIMNQQEKVNPQTKHVSYHVIQETKGRKYDVFDNNNPYYGVVVDDGVDVKASVYISCVQERFKLEHLNNELLHPAS